MSRRPTTPQMRNALKLATKSALFSSGGAAALVRDGYVRVKEAALSFCASPHADHHDRFVGIDTALDLDFAAGEPVHTRAMAEAQGWRLEPMQEPVVSGTVCHRGLNRFSRAMNETEMCLREALDDGDIDAAEARQALRLLDDLEAMVAEKRAKLNVLARGEG